MSWWSFSTFIYNTIYRLYNEHCLGIHYTLAHEVRLYVRILFFLYSYICIFFFWCLESVWRMRRPANTRQNRKTHTRTDILPTKNKLNLLQIFPQQWTITNLWKRVKNQFFIVKVFIKHTHTRTHSHRPTPGYPQYRTSKYSIGVGKCKRSYVYACVHSFRIYWHMINVCSSFVHVYPPLISIMCIGVRS